MLFLTTFAAIILSSFCQQPVALEKRTEYNVTSNQEHSQELSSGKNSCRFAQLKCSYRTGCGQTLQSFIIECDGLIHNKTRVCNERCKNTLVGLTSTLEGQKLMNCSCDGDAECEVAKSNIESCRASVSYATRNDTIVSCTEARWICAADAECGKALEYYHLYCRAMFRGRTCSERCKNSLNILQRQSKAVKLTECQCQPQEQIDGFPCQDIKQNMLQLCFAPEAEPDLSDTTLANDLLELEDDLEENEIDVDENLVKSGAASRATSILIMAVILMLCKI